MDISEAPVTINGIPCFESVRNYEEGVSLENLDFSKSYYCLWRDRYRVANGALGLTTITGPRGSTTQFTHPMKHPESPNAYAKDIRITGHGRPRQGPKQLEFDVAEVRIQFMIPQYDIQPGDQPNDSNIDPATSFIYATQSIQDGEESVEMPASAFKRDGTGIRLARNFAIPFSHSVMSITFHRLPYIPVATLPLKNCVNAAKFLGCNRGEVKFRGSTVQRQGSSDGSIVQEVTNTYHYRPTVTISGKDYAGDWNNFPNPDPVIGGWTKVVYSNGDAIFPYKDLSVTFPKGYF
jgi:hypothetical protein